MNNEVFNLCVLSTVANLKQKMYIGLRLYCTVSEGPDMIANHVDGSRNQVESLAEPGIRNQLRVLDILVNFSACL